ncbi:MAG: N-acetylmuramoyl-L-alanine amidase [Bacteroidota bacterium]
MRLLLFFLTWICLIWPDNFEIFNTFNNQGKYSQENRIDEARYYLRTVVIDAGHGGRDPGCSHHNKNEKHISLSVALQLGRMIQQQYPEVKVIYTRTKDVFVPLHKRAEIANRNDADLFISIHCNSIVNADHIHGSETYVMGLHRAKDNLAVAKRENEAILYESDYRQHYHGFDPNSAEGHIILSMFQNAYLEKSIRFAELVEKNLRDRTHRKSRGVKQAGFLVLRETTMPSALIETGYLSNLSDNKYLASQYGQYSVAQAIFHGFREYKAEIENQGSLTSSGVPRAVKEELPSPGIVHTIPGRQTKAQTAKGLSADFVPARPTPQSFSPLLLKSKNKTSQNHQTTKSQNHPITKSSNLKTTKSQNHPITKSPNPQTTRSPNHQISYKVQLAVSADHIPPTSKYWKNANYTIEVKKQHNLFKYMAVGFKDYAEAAKAKQDLRQNGFSEAFVVAFKGGERIPVSRARGME